MTILNRYGVKVEEYRCEENKSLKYFFFLDLIITKKKKKKTSTAESLQK